MFVKVESFLKNNWCEIEKYIYTFGFSIVQKKFSMFITFFSTLHYHINTC